MPSDLVKHRAKALGLWVFYMELSGLLRLGAGPRSIWLPEAFCSNRPGWHGPNPAPTRQYRSS